MAFKTNSKDLFMVTLYLKKLRYWPLSFKCFHEKNLWNSKVIQWLYNLQLVHSNWRKTAGYRWGSLNYLIVFKLTSVEGEILHSGHVEPCLFLFGSHFLCGIFDPNYSWSQASLWTLITGNSKENTGSTFELQRINKEYCPNLWKSLKCDW